MLLSEEDRGEPSVEPCGQVIDPTRDEPHKFYDTSIDPQTRASNNHDVSERALVSSAVANSLGFLHSLRAAAAR